MDKETELNTLLTIMKKREELQFELLEELQSCFIVDNTSVFNTMGGTHLILKTGPAFRFSMNQ